MLISFAVTAKLICVFVFAYAKRWFSHEAAQMIASVRFCLSYDLLNAILSPSKFVDFNKKKCIVVTDVIMALLVPAKSVM